MNNELPLADLVAEDVTHAIDTKVVQRIGYGPLRKYVWPENENDQYGSWPFVVVRDGREFEVDIDVRVTELTPEVKARREKEVERVLAMLKRFPS